MNRFADMMALTQLALVTQLQKLLFVALSSDECIYFPEKFPIMAVALGIVIPIVLGLTVVAVHLVRMAQAQAKSDHEWIAPLRQLKFRRLKKNAAGETASHISDEEPPPDGTETDSSFS